MNFVEAEDIRMSPQSRFGYGNAAEDGEFNCLRDESDVGSGGWADGMRALITCAIARRPNSSFLSSSAFAMVW
jgi:hypothetical protein